MKRFGTLGILLVLAACSHVPASGEAPPGISYRVEGGSLAAYDRRAEQYCQRFGKHAQRSNVEHDDHANIAEYACS